MLKEIGRGLLRKIYEVPESVLKENFSYHFDILINSPTVLFDKIKVIGILCCEIAPTKEETVQKIVDLLNHCQLLIWIPDDFSKSILNQVVEENIHEFSSFALNIFKSDLIFRDLMVEYQQVYRPLNFFGVSCLHVTRNE